jgi:hypothetical protein
VITADAIPVEIEGRNAQLELLIVDIKKEWMLLSDKEIFGCSRITVEVQQPTH